MTAAIRDKNIDGARRPSLLPSLVATAASLAPRCEYMDLSDHPMNNRRAHASARRSHDVNERSGDGGTIEPRRRLASQTLTGLGKARGDRMLGTGDEWKISRQRRYAHQRAARPRRILAVVAVLRRWFSGIGRAMHMHAAMIVDGMIVHDAFGMRHRHRMHMRRGGGLHLIGQARKRRPECER
ncbi:hypothetical protein RX327_24645 [Bradyrhizobium sp. BEA-2-5]|uniref:hypothetical protein n=1 Tax=Bradyrhizobium TaxID=374 RepID=UPI001873A973|nr:MULTISPECIES: hypothetical protein [Bradyrhizobium]WOH79090.1 hypothetical protein RX327_24645 [Bradyrhizobium sp. BEA-2-5]